MSPSTIKPTPLTLYPTKDSLDEVIDRAVAQLPITEKNVLMTVLGTYHNSLLASIKGETP